MRWLSDPSTAGGGARAAARVRNRDLGAGAAEVGALRRADRRRHSGDAEVGARTDQRRGWLAALVRSGGAHARGTIGGGKPDDSRRVFDGKQISVDVERWGDTDRAIVRHRGAVASVAVGTDDYWGVVR